MGYLCRCIDDRVFYRGFFSAIKDPVINTTTEMTPKKRRINKKLRSFSLFLFSVFSLCLCASVLNLRPSRIKLRAFNDKIVYPDATFLPN